MPVITPTTEGQDLVAPFKISRGAEPFRSYDAHIRLEEQEVVPGVRSTVVCADVFDSTELDNSKAHVESECEPWGNGGAKRITEFLQSYGFDVTVRFA
jgi:hypothetical protein